MYVYIDPFNLFGITPSEWVMSSNIRKSQQKKEISNKHLQRDPRFHDKRCLFGITVQFFFFFFIGSYLNNVRTRRHNNDDDEYSSDNKKNRKMY